MSLSPRRRGRQEGHDGQTPHDSRMEPAFGGVRKEVGNTRTITSEEDPDPTGPYTGTMSAGTRGRTTGGPEGPTEDEVRRRAYEIYQARGGEPGHEREDWDQAERELRQKRKVA